MFKFGTREQYAQYNRYFSKLKETYDTKPIVRDSLQLLLSLLTISFLVLFALRPTINTVSELYAKVRLQQEVSQKLDTKIQSLTLARQVWEREQDKLILINQALPDKPQPEIFLQQIEGLAAIHNTTIDGFSEENVVLSGKDLRKAEQKTDEASKQDLPSTKSTRFSLTIFGQYTNVVNFLHDLENLRGQNVIQTYTLSINTSTTLSSITLKITGTIPYLDMESIKAQ